MTEFKMIHSGNEFVRLLVKLLVVWDLLLTCTSAAVLRRVIAAARPTTSSGLPSGSHMCICDLLNNIEIMFKNIHPGHKPCRITLSMDEVMSNGRLSVI
jgi:hypothetical protein